MLGFNLNSYAAEVFFDSDNLKIEEEGNMIFATKGFAKIPSQNLEIKGDKFIYNKLISYVENNNTINTYDLTREQFLVINKKIYNLKIKLTK